MAPLISASPLGYGGPNSSSLCFVGKTLPLAGTSGNNRAKMPIRKGAGSLARRVSATPVSLSRLYFVRCSVYKYSPRRRNSVLSELAGAWAMPASR